MTAAVKMTKQEKFRRLDIIIDEVRSFFVFCNVGAGTRYMIAKYIWQKGSDASLVEISAALQILKKNAEITFEKGVWFAIAIK